MSDLSWTRPRHPVHTRLDVVASWLGAALPAGAGDVVVTGLTLSSQGVVPGDLYAALPGSRTHGASYAQEAVARGAVAVLTDTEGAVGLSQAPVLVADRLRARLGDLAARIYGRPADALTLLAVTGTQGKTTTTRLAESGMRAAGISAAVVGTVGTRIDGTEVQTALTTPEAPDLHALFAVMRERGVTACAMEVSSHALVLGRVAGVVFDVAAFTNLGRDHLDFHDGVEDYFAAKASLFTPERARRGLVNLDDAHGRRLLAQAQIPTAGFSTLGTAPAAAEAEWRACDAVLAATGATFTVQGPGGLRFPAKVPLAGDFNVSNALCAIAAAGEAGLDAEAVARGMASGGGVPGRLERVDAGQRWLGIVDYAHKPDAVAAALDTLRPLTEGRLLVVIGAGGDRDHGKRPIMGEIAARLADVLVVTDDNPRTEDPAAIRAEILAGVPARGRADVHEVGDRRSAIALAVGLAKPGDTVLVAGKGHETGQEVAGVVHPFDDREVLRELAGSDGSAG